MHGFFMLIQECKPLRILVKERALLLWLQDLEASIAFLRVPETIVSTRTAAVVRLPT